MALGLYMLLLLDQVQQAALEEVSGPVVVRVVGLHLVQGLFGLVDV